MHISGKGVFHDINGASQQRDCPGFTPDSLLIHIPEWYMRNRFGGKDSIFYLTIHFSQAGIYGIHGSQVKFRTISSQEKLMHKALKINIKKTG